MSWGQGGGIGESDLEMGDGQHAGGEKIMGPEPGWENEWELRRSE